MLKTINVQTDQVSKQKIKKKSKNLNVPLKPTKAKKSKKEWSNELMLKTINVQKYQVSKKNSQISKTQKQPPKTPQNQKIKEGVLQ